MRFLARIVLLGAVSMVLFNTSAFYLNTGSIRVDRETVFTVVRLRSNIDDIGSWCLGMTNRAADELEGMTEEFKEDLK